MRGSNCDRGGGGAPPPSSAPTARMRVRLPEHARSWYYQMACKSGQLVQTGRSWGGEASLAREGFGVWIRYWRRQTLTTRITAHAHSSTAQYEQNERTLSKVVKLHKRGSTQGSKRKNLYTARKEKIKPENFPGPQKQTAERRVVNAPKVPKITRNPRKKRLNPRSTPE